MPDYSVTKAAVLSLFAARRRRVREGRDPLQRGHARSDGDARRGSREGGLADQQGARAEVLARVLAAVGGDGRSAGSPSRRRSRRSSRSSAPTRASYVTGAAWSADGGTVPIII